MYSVQSPPAKFLYSQKFVTLGVERDAAAGCLGVEKKKEEEKEKRKTEKKKEKEEKKEENYR